MAGKNIPGFVLLITLLGPQSRFGDKLLTIRVCCPHIWKCGSKRVNPVPGKRTSTDPQVYEHVLRKWQTQEACFSHSEANQR